MPNVAETMPLTVDKASALKVGQLAEKAQVVVVGASPPPPRSPLGLLVAQGPSRMRLALVAKPFHLTV